MSLPVIYNQYQVSGFPRVVKSCGVVYSFCVLRGGLCAELEWGFLLLGGLGCES